MLASGWESLSVARQYTKPKHAWKFMERGEQPVPVFGENVCRLVYGDWSSKQWWPAWLRKELRELAAEAQADGEVLGTTGQSIRKRRRTQSAGPPEREGGLNQQDRQGQSRRQWAHNRRMEKVMEIGEAVGIDPVRVHDAVCDQVQAKERLRVSEAVRQLLLGVRHTTHDHAAETMPVVVGCLTKLAEKGFDPEDEDSYYGDEEDKGEVGPSTAAKGLGQVGNVPIQDTLWSRCVPEDLESRYRKWRTDLGGAGSSDGVRVREMLDALVQDGALSKRDGGKEGGGKAQVRPKSSTKCALILNCVKQNECDGRKPRGFQLPQIEQLRDSILLGGIWRNWIYRPVFGVCGYPSSGLVISVYV